MKVYTDIIQGTPEWLALRAGIPTASVFSEIVTPGGKLSKSADRLMYTLLSERMTGKPTVEHVSYWMDRGTTLEADALDYYLFQTGLTTTKVGIVLNDAGTVGASPDSFVEEDGLLEIKCPSPAIHVSYLLGKAGVDEKYRPQVQGQLWITGRKFVDTVSFHPDLPFALVRAQRDEAYIALLSEAVEEFSAKLESEWKRIVDEGIVKPPQKPVVTAPAFGITDEDVAALMADRFPGEAA